MREAPITFVGSSLLIVFNLARPDKSDVKLIDPDHPIVLDHLKKELQKISIPRDVMTSAHFKPTPSREDFVEGMGEVYSSYSSYSSSSSSSSFTVPGRTYEDYVKKWQTSFSTGLSNFIQWFSRKISELSARDQYERRTPTYEEQYSTFLKEYEDSARDPFE